MPATTRGGWPDRMRVIARRERPHPGAQLRLTDHDGWRITCFATNTQGGRIADLEVRHRQRARTEDRIRGLKDTGLRNLPLHGFAQNQIWLESVALATDLLTWTQTLAWHDQPARTWEPKRLRFRLLGTAGRITRSGRRRRLRLPRGSLRLPSSSATYRQRSSTGVNPSTHSGRHRRVVGFESNGEPETGVSGDEGAVSALVHPQVAGAAARGADAGGPYSITKPPLVSAAGRPSVCRPEATKSAPTTEIGGGRTLDAD
jgi:hypothetical protein